MTSTFRGSFFMQRRGISPPAGGERFRACGRGETGKFRSPGAGDFLHRCASRFLLPVGRNKRGAASKFARFIRHRRRFAHFHPAKKSPKSRLKPRFQDFLFCVRFHETKGGVPLSVRCLSSAALTLQCAACPAARHFVVRDACHEYCVKKRTMPRCDPTPAGRCLRKCPQQASASSGNLAPAEPAH